MHDVGTEASVDVGSADIVSGLAVLCWHNCAATRSLTRQSSSKVTQLLLPRYLFRWFVGCDVYSRLLTSSVLLLSKRCQTSNVVLLLLYVVGWALGRFCDWDSSLFSYIHGTHYFAVDLDLHGLSERVGVTVAYVTFWLGWHFLSSSFWFRSCFGCSSAEIVTDQYVRKLLFVLCHQLVWHLI